jgi:hypothetical protein
LAAVKFQPRWKSTPVPKAPMVHAVSFPSVDGPESNLSDLQVVTEATFLTIHGEPMVHASTSTLSHFHPWMVPNPIFK